MVREQHIARWKEQSRIAEEEARKSAPNIKENRETKLFRKCKCIESLSNMESIPSSKQPLPQRENLTEALTGLIGITQKMIKNSNCNSKAPKEKDQPTVETYQENKDLQTH